MSWLNCGVTTQTSWPIEQKEVIFGKYTLVLMPPTRENSASIHIQLIRIDDVQGLTIINRFLSALSWKDDEPAINHYGWSGSLAPSPVPKHRIPYGYSPIEHFPDEIYEITDKEAKRAIALYREARNLDSTPFQFLSYFKILNIFWNDQTKHGKNELVENLRSTLQDINEKDCVKRIREIIETYGDAADYLYKSGRCAVAHAFAKRGTIVDSDDVTDLRRLSKDMCIMKNLTAHLIVKHFNIEQSIWA